MMTLRGSNGAEAQVLLQDEYQYASDEEVGLKIEACMRNLHNVAACLLYTSNSRSTFRLK